MRAWQVEKGGLRLQAEAPAPRAGVGEAVVRPSRVSLSSADADAARRRSGEHDGRGGAGETSPFVPGSQFAGVVEALAEAAEKADRERWLGKRVVGSPTIACGACDLCRAGLSVHCRSRRVLGRPGGPGCLAERFLIPARNLVLVPPGVDDDRAVFAWAVASAVHCAQVVRVEGKAHVTVLGDTVEGLIAAQVLARLNGSVRVLGTRPDRLALCEKWASGIKHRHMDEAGRRQDQDIVVECTGTPAGLGVALQMVRPRGSVVLQRPILGADLSAVVDNEVTLVGARDGPLGEALGLLVRAEIDVLGLIGRRFKLADAAAALAAAGDPGGLRVLVEF